MLRNVLALLAGILAMFLVTWSLEALGHLAFPLPSGLDPRDPAQAQAFARYLATMPLGAQAALVLAWSGGAFAGGFVGARFARHPRSVAVAVGALVVAGVIGMIMRVPHPSWVAAAGLVLPIPLALWAARLARPRIPLTD